MKIRYVWPVSNNKEINSITFKGNNVPIKGELISIDMEIEKGEYVNVHGRVKDVQRRISKDGIDVTVYIT